MKMKKYIIGLVAASLFLTSCEDFLTVVPETQLSSATFFKNQNDFEQAVNAAAKANPAEPMSFLVGGR